MTGYNQSTGASDPFEFVRNLWGGAGFPLPGMVTPTLDADELGKRISEMRSVENWLRMNLNMLQMTIQGLEMQQATLNAVRAMGDSYQQQSMKNAEAAAAAAAAAPQEKADKAGKEAKAPQTKAKPAEPASNPFADMAAAATAAASMWPWKLMDSSTAAEKSAEAVAAKKKAAAAKAKKPAAAAAKAKAAPARKTTTTSRTTPKR